MTDARYRNDVTVELIDSMGQETRIVQAAKVSTEGIDSKYFTSSTGLIRYLYREGHGSPFEHVVMTFYVESPLFVGRQILRHRTSSFNEESGRYKELEGVFYMPDRDRKIVQVGKTGMYEFVEGKDYQHEAIEGVIDSTATASWYNYNQLLELGIAKEVARMILPVNIYSSMYYTANLRSVLNFMSLRKDWGADAVHQSKAQREIEMVADKMSAVVKEKWPTVYECFVNSGYQAV